MVTFVGKKKKGFFIQTVFPEETCDFVECAGHIQTQVNEILKYDNDYIIVDLEQYMGDTRDIVIEIEHIQNASGAKNIFFAPGYHEESMLVRELIKKGFRCFIFGLRLSEKKDQLEKCVNGYYDTNEIPEMERIKQQREEEQQAADKQGNQGKTIAIAGICNRIGVTTVAIQLIQYFRSKNKSACYIEMNETNYLKKLKRYQEESEEEAEEAGFLYQSILHVPMDQEQEIRTEDFDYLIYDFGCYRGNEFQKAAFLEKEYQFFVLGVSPSEFIDVDILLRNNFYQKVSYIYNLTAQKEESRILKFMGEKKEQTFFMPYAPDPYSLDESKENKLFEHLFPILNVEQMKKSKKMKKGIPYFLKFKKEFSYHSTKGLKKGKEEN